MKDNIPQKYARMAVYGLIFIAVATLLVMFLFEGRDFFAEKKYTGVLQILNPFIFGFVFAYLLNPLLIFFENRIFYKVKLKFRRLISLFATFLTAALVISLISLMIFPQVGESVNQLVTNITDLFSAEESALPPLPPERYIDEFDALHDEISSNDPEQVYDFLMTLRIGKIISDAASSIQHFISGFGLRVDIESSLREVFLTSAARVTVLFTEYFQTIFDATTSFIMTAARQVMNILVALIIAFYILSDKEHLISQFKRLLFAIFPTSFAKRAVSITKKTHRIFGGFIHGKILDSLIIGVICFICMTVFRIDYAMLISVIVGITNVIPFFGPFIGAIPSIIFLAINDPSQAVWFTVFILILQQIDGNIIGPKIIGDTIGLSSFWVIFSILVMNGLLGIVGMFIGVPLFAVIYMLVKEFAGNRLTKKGLHMTEQTSKLEEIIKEDAGTEEPAGKKLSAALDKLMKNIQKYVNKDKE